MKLIKVILLSVEMRMGTETVQNVILCHIDSVIFQNVFL